MTGKETSSLGTAASKLFVVRAILIDYMRPQSGAADHARPALQPAWLLRLRQKEDLGGLNLEMLDIAAVSQAKDEYLANKQSLSLSPEGKTKRDLERFVRDADKVLIGLGPHNMPTHSDEAQASQYLTRVRDKCLSIAAQKAPGRPSCPFLMQLLETLERLYLGAGGQRSGVTKIPDTDKRKSAFCTFAWQVLQDCKPFTPLSEQALMAYWEKAKRNRSAKIQSNTRH